MAWNDTPPTTEELAQFRKPKRWDEDPPTSKELQALRVGQDWKEEPALGGLGTKGGFIKGALEALPTVGAIGGGLVGTPLGLAGMAGGAGLGAGLGASAKQLGEKYLLGEEAKPLGERVQEIGQESAKGVLGEAAAPYLAKGIEKVAEKVAPVALKTTESLTGIPKRAIEVFKQAPEKVQSLYTRHEGNLPNMADEVKQFAMDSIFARKAELNKTIENSLKGSNAQVDIIPIKRALIDTQTHLDPKVKTDAKQIEQINDLINQITQASQDGKTIPIQTANRFKASFQEQASQSYAKPGEIYSLGKDSARAAKNAAAQIRTQIDKELPDLAKANKVHSELHDLEDQMHVNLLGVSKPEGSLIAAGSGANQRNANILKKLSDITGENILGRAEELSAARYFGSPAILPEGPQTGAMVARQGLGGVLGGALGSGLGYLSPFTGGAVTGGLVGREAGKILTSPAVTAKEIEFLNYLQQNPEIRDQVLKALGRGLYTPTAETITKAKEGLLSK